MDSPVLEYGRDRGGKRGRRLAIVAMALAMVSLPPVSIGVVMLTGDTIDEWVNGRPLHLVLYSIVCVPGLVAAGLGAMSGRRLGIVAAVVGVGSVVVNAVLVARALAA